MSPPAGSATTKTTLREAALKRRAELSPRTRELASAAIAERVVTVLGKTRPRAIAAYLPFGGEVDPGAILQWAAANKLVTAVPAMVDTGHMVFRRYVPDDPLVRDAFGIASPTAEAPVVDPDLLVMPVSGFDRSGNRLGKGRGHYDRVIADLRARGFAPLLVGVAFSVQEVPSVPAEPHDVRLDMVVTETETVAFQR